MSADEHTYHEYASEQSCPLKVNIVRLWYPTATVSCAVLEKSIYLQLRSTIAKLSFLAHNYIILTPPVFVPARVLLKRSY